VTMSGVQQPRPEPQGGRRQPDLVPLLIDRWAQLAMQRPWRYLATWAVGIGVANLGLRMLLNDLSLAHNARLAILTAVGFSMFAWLYTAQLTRPLRRRRPNLGLTRPSPSRAAQPTGAPSRRAASAGQRWPTVRAPLVMSTTWGDVHLARQAAKRRSRSRLRRWRLVLTAVAVTTVALALVLGAAVRQGPAPRGGPDVVVPSQRS
jgi:hypothetical protein